MELPSPLKIEMEGWVLKEVTCKTNGGWGNLMVDTVLLCGYVWGTMPDSLMIVVDVCWEACDSTVVVEEMILVVVVNAVFVFETSGFFGGWFSEEAETKTEVVDEDLLEILSVSAEKSESVEEAWTIEDDGVSTWMTTSGVVTPAESVVTVE